ncbi:MAG: FAD-dependent oxidoreductase [Planctomycetota bacterium]
MRGSRVAIIGAGAGGASLALRLARAGFDVTVIESQAFPRAKVCGEFISPAATPDLESVLTPNELREAGAARVRTLALELGDRQRTWNMPEPAWALSRRSLDVLLIEKAAAAGAHVLQPVRVASVEYNEDSATVHFASRESIHTDLVLHADGSGRFDPAGATPKAKSLVGLKCHARPTSPVRGIRMRSARGVYCGAIGIEDGLATFAMCATPQALAAHKGDRDALLASVWPGFTPDQREGPWMTSAVARSRYTRPGHPRSFRVGNAAAAVDPVGGEGIGLALWSVARLAELLESETDPRVIHDRFAKLYRRRLRTRLPACRTAAEVLLRPRLVQALWPMLGVPSLTIRPWYALTGKPVSAG